MVKLSVLLTTICLHLVCSRRLPDDIDNEIDNDISAFPADNFRRTIGLKYGDFVRIDEGLDGKYVRKVGDHLELTCTATGSPPPTIEWFRDNQQITEQESFEQQNELFFRTSSTAQVSSRLVFNYLLPLHSGQYYCVAFGESRKVKSKTSIIVHGKELNRDELIEKQVLGAFHHPRVSFWATDLLEDQGKDVILPCRSVGNPLPKTTWTDSTGEEIKPGGRYEITQHGDLRIKSLMWADMGRFICTVENVLGTDSVDTFLYPLASSAKSAN